VGPFALLGGVFLRPLLVRFIGVGRKAGTDRVEIVGLSLLSIDKVFHWIRLLSAWSALRVSLVLELA